MAASIASPARPTPSTISRPGSISRASCSPSPTPPICCARELAAPRYECRPIAFGTNTDPYQPIEGSYRITRACLEVLAETRHPLTITTKSDRVVSDIDLLAGMAANGLAAVAISITSLDPRTARTLEPRAPHPERRLTAVSKLADAGIPVNVSIAPVVPADHRP